MMIHIRRRVLALASLLLVGGGACSFDVTQPGRAEDSTLNDPAAFTPLVAGMSESLSHALWQIAFLTAETSREYIEGGRIFTTKLTSVPGTLTREAGGTVGWTTAQQARWVAEDGVQRFKDQLPDFSSNALVAQAYVHAGFANRLLGETTCEAVIDGGPAQPDSIYFLRADSDFTAAIAIATAAKVDSLVNVAYAGRASVRLSLGHWTAAAADAALVPTTLRYTAKFTNTSLDQYNSLYWANANSPFRTFSVVTTFFEQYYLDTGDPRVAWGTDPKTPTAEIATVKWEFPLKYRANTDPINLVTGHEARLIEAEVALRNGQVADALARINAVRTANISTKTNAPLDPWPATTSADSVWHDLAIERGNELYLEGRRIWDLRRFSEDNIAANDVVDVHDRIRLCEPIPSGELNTNPNLTADHSDPTNPLYTGG